jgi:DNA-binding response OmpR family regulator
MGESHGSSTGGGETRVLLVEDNDVAAKVAAALLARADRRRYSVERAADLRTAAELLCCRPFDVVLLDLNLPDSQGLATFVEVRCLSKAPVIVLTGDDDDELGGQVLDHGAQDYLVKGKYDRALLDRAIGNAVRRHRFDDENRKAISELVDASIRYERQVRDIERRLAALKGEGDSRERAAAECRELASRYRRAFDAAPVPLWAVDFSRVFALFEKIAAKGAVLESYFAQHSSEIGHCLSLARLLAINAAARALIGAADLDEAERRFLSTFTAEAHGAFLSALLSLSRGAGSAAGDTVLRSLAEDEIPVSVLWSNAAGKERDLSLVVYAATARR